jgi:hypothetical protein
VSVLPRTHLIAPGVAAALLLVFFVGPAAWTGDDRHLGVSAFAALLAASPLPLLWLGAAFGLGGPLVRWLRLDGSNAGDAAVQAGVGVAAMLVLDAALGRLGWLFAGGGIAAWVVIGVGLVLLAGQLWRRHRAGVPRESVSPLVVVGAPAVGVLLLAAVSDPGWLWATEFGGYDALSYHLQLPREWLAAGHVGGLDHNVYAHLPSYVEGAFAHLFALRGGDAFLESQLLHAGLALVTAGVVVPLGARLAGPRAGAIAAVLVIGTPWVVVVGSLAYDEMAVALLLATGLLVLHPAAAAPGDTPPDRGPGRRRAAAVGLLAGAACGAKLTAIGFVAAPLGLLLVLDAGAARRAATSALAATGAGALALAPFLVGNTIETGNPLFPFAAGLLGPGHWSAEQVTIWAEGHRAGGSIADRAAAAWHQLLRYGIGPAPRPDEPWRAQWSVLPALTVVAAVVGLRSARRRATARLLAVLAVQTLFWLGFTHVKSRFMVPAVVPAALVVALAAETLVGAAGSERGRRLAATAVGAALLAYAVLPALLFAGEQDGRPAAAIGAAAVFTGEAHASRLRAPDLPEPERLALLREAPAAYWINHLLAPGARVLCVGEAAPLYYRLDRIAYQTTWDRGALSRAMRESEEPAAWFRELREAGYTHVLVDPVMLRLWEEEGWNDPLLTVERVTGAAERHAAPEQRNMRYTLYRL